MCLRNKDDNEEEVVMDNSGSNLTKPRKIAVPHSKRIGLV